MYAIMTVTGKDRTGIIAQVTAKLADNDVNIVDVSQTLMSGFFTMIMRLEFDENKTTIEHLRTELSPVAASTEQYIRIQSEALFTAMHEV